MNTVTEYTTEDIVANHHWRWGHKEYRTGWEREALSSKGDPFGMDRPTAHALLRANLDAANTEQRIGTEAKTLRYLGAAAYLIARLSPQ